MNDFSTQGYSSDEVDRIMRRALKLENEDVVSYHDLIDTAKKIGLDPQVVEAAIKQEQREYQDEKRRTARLKRRKACFYSHLRSYLIVNTALVLINNITPGPWWFQWSLLGWGIGLAFHFKAVFFPGNSRLKRARKPKHGRARVMMCG